MYSNRQIYLLHKMLHKMLHQKTPFYCHKLYQNSKYNGKALHLWRHNMLQQHIRCCETLPGL